MYFNLLLAIYFLTTTGPFVLIKMLYTSFKNLMCNLSDFYSSLSYSFFNWIKNIFDEPGTTTSSPSPRPRPLPPAPPSPPASPISATSSLNNIMNRWRLPRAVPDPNYLYSWERLLGLRDRFNNSTSYYDRLMDVFSYIETPLKYIFYSILVLGSAYLAYNNYEYILNIFTNIGNKCYDVCVNLYTSAWNNFIGNPPALPER